MSRRATVALFAVLAVAAAVLAAAGAPALADDKAEPQKCPPGYRHHVHNGIDNCTAPGEIKGMWRSDAWARYQAEQARSGASRSTRSGADSLGTRAAVEMPPIRTISEGQSTTFAVPGPQNRQEIFCSPATTIYIVTTTIIDGVEYSTTTSKTRAAGAHNLPVGEERSSDEPFTCGTGSKRTVYGICQGPYTVELGTGDSRVEAPGGTRIRVATSNTDNLDDSGSLEIVYYLHGTRTKASAHYSGVDVVTSDGCTLRDTTRVVVRPARRPGMTAAVALHTPADSYRNTPSTVTWTCSQEIIDEGVQCELDTVITTTSTPTFETPRGCKIVVTVAADGRSFGSTGCLTSAGVAEYEATLAGMEIPVDVSSLPACPLSTDPADLKALDMDASGRRRCVARN